MEIISMSTKEIDRLEVIQKVEDKRVQQKEAGVILGVCLRQIKRLTKAYREDGASGLISKHRGEKSNNCLSDEAKKKALDLLKSKYQLNLARTAYCLKEPDHPI